MAKLIFNYSAMNSGKTMDLLRTAYNYEENGHHVIVMKPEIDTKGENKIVTRIGLNRTVDYLIKEKTSITKLLKNKLEKTKCILIDEAQFLNEKQVDELFKITKEKNIPIICYGLRTDFKMNLFNGSSRLLALADELNEFKSLCNCGEMARFNARKIDGEYTLIGEKVLIDGTKNIEYIPLCGKCYIEKVIKKNKN